MRKLCFRSKFFPKLKDIGSPFRSVAELPPRMRNPLKFLPYQVSTSAYLIVLRVVMDLGKDSAPKTRSRPSYLTRSKTVHVSAWDRRLSQDTRWQFADSPITMIRCCETQLLMLYILSSKSSFQVHSLIPSWPCWRRQCVRNIDHSHPRMFLHTDREPNHGQGYGGSLNGKRGTGDALIPHSSHLSHDLFHFTLWRGKIPISNSSVRHVASTVELRVKVTESWGCVDTNKRFLSSSLWRDCLRCYSQMAGRIADCKGGRLWEDGSPSQCWPTLLRAISNLGPVH